MLEGEPVGHELVDMIEEEGTESRKFGATWREFLFRANVVVLLLA